MFKLKAKLNIPRSVHLNLSIKQFIESYELNIFGYFKIIFVVLVACFALRLNDNKNKRKMLWGLYTDESASAFFFLFYYYFK